MDLFENKLSANSVISPLADRMRPRKLDDFAGQDHLVGTGKVIRRMVDSATPVSMLLWGPPGVGKTTLARIIANQLTAQFITISAVSSGLADVRKILVQAGRQRLRNVKTVLFIDEIHRFNKVQQDALLHAVEDGTITLIGATTENPSFEVISALQSRCRTYRLEALGVKDLLALIDRALLKDSVLKKQAPTLTDEAKNALAALAGGDARAVLSGLELCVDLASQVDGRLLIDIDTVKEAMQRKTVHYDKDGEGHFDTISAFIKSMRGSDPDAAIYWLARMIDAGEDPLFIARRMLILASEDVGNADPQALVIANSAFQAVHVIGMPEARIILSQAAAYLASAPKSNAAYVAIGEALSVSKETPDAPVPMHMRNAPTRLMKDMGYGKDYQYAHDYEDGFAGQSGLPEGMEERIFYRPKSIGFESRIKDRLDALWPKRSRK
ncbi:replication-associated recombination protein A [bacterium]|nr:replication-associated recombination protein A [bacterium]